LVALPEQLQGINPANRNSALYYWRVDGRTSSGWAGGFAAII
jgi:hypothetical protein